MKENSGAANLSQCREKRSDGVQTPSWASTTVIQMH